MYNQRIASHRVFADSNHIGKIVPLASNFVNGGEDPKAPPWRRKKKRCLVTVITDSLFLFNLYLE
jgi:hypothetical protein